jgi:lipopolysaccharide transport system permease protein
MRDTGLLVDVAMTLGFYLTPVFYDPESVPDQFRAVIDLNPMAHMLEFHRDILVEGRFPPTGGFAALALLSLGVLTLGLLAYRRLSPTFVDEL